jgi:hypothetical protein
MSYFETLPGRGRPGYSEGMGASFQGAADKSRTPNEGLRALQQALQRMGIPAAPAAPLVADGLWNFHTGAALATARLQLRHKPMAFTTTNGGRLVTVPDDFIAAIQAAAVGPSAPSSPALGPGPDPSSTPSSTPALPAGLTTEATPVPPAVEPPSRTKLYLAIGGAVVVVGGIATYALWPKKKSTPNRRTRRNRRRRTSRR